MKYDTDVQQALLKTSHGRRAPRVIIPLLINFQEKQIHFFFQTGQVPPTTTQKVEFLFIHFSRHDQFLQGGFFSRVKNIFGRQKNAGPPPPPGTSSGQLGTASRAAQQPNSVIGAPPGSASRRPQTGTAGGQRRPTTAVQGAGFTIGSSNNSTSASVPTQFEKKEETYV